MADLLDERIVFFGGGFEKVRDGMKHGDNDCRPD